MSGSCRRLLVALSALVLLGPGCTKPKPGYTPDASVVDGAPPDGATADASAPDASSPDASSPDAPPDANLPSLSIVGATVEEGDTVGPVATFTVALSAPATDTVTAVYATADDTATEADGDYTPTAGTLTIPTGETGATIEVQVSGDFQSERNEQFRVTLSGPSGAVLEAAEGIAVVEDDDRGPDFNGDGFPDLLIGANEKAYLFFGKEEHEPGGAPEIVSALAADVIFASEGLGDDLDGFGRTVAFGDVNADGFDDAIVAADNPETSGSEPFLVVYVFPGSASPPATIGAESAGRTISIDGNFRIGSLAVVDVNGDGFGDLLVGGNEAVYLFSGAADFTNGADLGVADATATFIGDIGTSFPSNVGDSNGDGHHDLLITTDAFGGGSAHLFLGGAALGGQIGLAAADVTLQGIPGDRIIGVGGADINGDGIADIALGSPEGDTLDGGVSVFLGRKDPPAAIAADVTIASDFDNAAFGASVSLGGDLDGDGRGDLIAGVPNLNGGQALLFLGKATFPGTLTSDQRDARVIAEAAGDSLTASMAILDFNGDGFHDLAVGAPGAADNGEVYLFLGFAGAFRAGGPQISSGDADVRFESAPDASSLGVAIAN